MMQINSLLSTVVNRTSFGLLSIEVVYSHLHLAESCREPLAPWGRISIPTRCCQKL